MKLFRRRKHHEGPHILLEVSLNGVNVIEVDCESLMYIAKFSGTRDLLELHDSPLKITATPISYIRR